jgi:hypothetical protein
MKISTASTAASILSGIRLNRITDKDAKAALLKDYLALRRVAKEADADKDEIIRKFQEDWADELRAVQSFREKNRPVIGHLDYLEAEKDANKAISAIFSADVEIDLSPVEISAVADFSEDITLEQIAFLQECGIVEG